MGQAKNRGPLEARIEAAKQSSIQSRDPVIESLRETLEIPARIKFLGYRVKVDSANQFLATVADGARHYVETPETATVFHGFDEASAMTQAEQGEVVVAVFDFGAKLLVANVPVGETAAD